MALVVVSLAMRRWSCRQTQGWVAPALLQLSSPGQTAGLDQPVSGTFLPSQQPQHIEPPSKVMESGLFPEALLFQHYTGLETSNLSFSGGTMAFPCSSHRPVTISTSCSWWQRGDLPAEW